MTNPLSIPLKIHPRVFQALGSELVTSDVVAIIELVKNSYDAFATRVDVRFVKDDEGKLALEIEDNGLGMNPEILDSVWCTVATPFRVNNPTSSKGSNKRRTTGAKGLGRLSAARLGDTMELLTRMKGGPVWQISVDWRTLAKAANLEACVVMRSEYRGSNCPAQDGTLIRIREVKSEWNRSELLELSEALSRLRSPFDAVGTFDIYLTLPKQIEESGEEESESDSEQPKPIKIVTSEFLKNPPYSIKGEFDADGNLNATYSYRPHGETRKKRDKTIEVDWAIVQADVNLTLPRERQIPVKKAPTCGPFEFEIRVWDLDKDSMAEAESHFGMKRSRMRSDIRAYKGISLYRDEVLVLPKSEKNRDWLGLDLRRVSKVGTRLSTTQLVGYVSIGADQNPGIEDTSDRERLARSSAVDEFERLLKDVVFRLEDQRSRDHETEEPQIRDLFSGLSPEKTLESAAEIAHEDGSTAQELMPVLTAYAKEVDKAKVQIERQFVYYSRMATVGTVTEMLVHEVGNNCAPIEALVKAVRDWLNHGKVDMKVLEKRLQIAHLAVESLQKLAIRFRPLANKGFVRGKRSSSFRESVEACLGTLNGAIEQTKISVTLDLKGSDVVKIDPGELYPVLYNIIHNAVYWLQHVKLTTKRKLVIKTRKRSEFLRIIIEDSGPGIAAEDITRIFLAGVTRRPNGSGMGLTVAGELVEGNQGSIQAESPGELGGATFIIELPLA